ncbi:MAG: F0F1 ATP synthase subunit B [Lachnospiraceae bacterium]|nr:F0F1 ATP synthase subunit B [Robinsoniella sp.]MDY3765574.1 F0F1 ATP synthase subunit B [Lachnospiraceae bacterium]
MERLFNLDAQLLFDAAILAISVFVMFTFLSYLLFNPVRDMLKKRQDRVKNDIQTAEENRDEALKLKADYEARIRNIDKEAEVILAEARQKALKNEAKILEDAKEEAARMIARANAQIELEKKKAADDMKREMISIASLMAEKVVKASMTANIEEQLVEDTLKEIGDQTWLS